MNYLQNETEFPCEMWFSKSKGDKKIKRILYPKGMTMDQIEAAEKGWFEIVVLKFKIISIRSESTILNNLNAL